ncbi:MAG: hypothetical protein U0R80_19040 [Nocardioidaceae bacterium]
MTRHTFSRALSLVTAGAAGAALALTLTGGGAAQSAHRPGGTDRHGSTVARTTTVAHYSAVLAAGAGKNTIYRYKLPTISSAPFTVSFPKLPQGPYAVTYSLTGGASDATGRFICWMDHGAGSQETAFTYSAAWNNFLTNNGSGVLDTREGDAKLHCNAVGTASTMPATTGPGAATVSFLRADAFIKRTAKVKP